MKKYIVLYISIVTNLLHISASYAGGATGGGGQPVADLFANMLNEHQEGSGGHENQTGGVTLVNPLITENQVLAEDQVITADILREAFNHSNSFGALNTSNSLAAFNTSNSLGAFKTSNSLGAFNTSNSLVELDIVDSYDYSLNKVKEVVKFDGSVFKVNDTRNMHISEANSINSIPTKFIEWVRLEKKETAEEKDEEADEKSPFTYLPSI